MTKSQDSVFEYFQFRSILGMDRSSQITLITALYVLMTLGYYFSVQKTGKMDGYSPGVSLLFVPIYEELLFRGIVLKFFEKYYGAIRAIVFTSLLFGLWHLKNIFWLSAESLGYQMAYTAFAFSPILCWITLKTRSVWPTVILHYLNNFPFSPWFERFH